ncbi:MAG: hypothetical protein M9962_11350 [Oligoflexia bacterium]|nr:hypothetical protein [Oligoflexia bacterium]
MNVKERNQKVHPSHIKAHEASTKPTWIGRIFAKLRPKKNQLNIDFNEAERMLSEPSWVEEVYANNDFESRMRGRYAGTVGSMESIVHNPLRRASKEEILRYDENRRDMANWTYKEVLNDQVKLFFKRGDSTSGAMQVLTAVKSVTSSEKEEDANSNEKLTEEERIARAHRADLVAHSQDEEEPVVPTRIRAKMNLIKKKGQLVFSNPLATTSVNVQAGSGENLIVEMQRDFRKLSMNSKLKYAVDESLIDFELKKKITDEISLNLNSLRYTDNKKLPHGKKSSETAGLLYSVSF